MRKIPANGIPEKQLTAVPTVVGLDVAANRKKGLRCVIRAGRDLWEATLKLRQPVRLCRAYPHVDIPLPDGEMTADYLGATFNVTAEEAKSLSHLIRRSQCAAIDAPAAFATGDRRVCETIWHKHLIDNIKPSVGGILWTPRQSDMDALFAMYFSAKDRCRLTTEQLTCLGQSLWMLIGFWLHEAFRRVGIRTIEVFPDALRAVCQHIATSPFADELRQDFANWGGVADNYSGFMRTKSETNDAAICCFTAYLWTQGKTEELHPGEIVVPTHRGARFQPATADLVASSEPARTP
jgi:predicted nuclease with RNAse H fold